MSDDAEILSERPQKGDFSAASELVSLFYQRIFAYLNARRQFAVVMETFSGSSKTLPAESPSK